MHKTNPTIDIQDVMARLRSEVKRRHPLQQPVTSRDGHSARPDLPELPAPPSRDALTAETLLPVGEIRQLLQLAKNQTIVSPRIPRLFRRLFRKQGGFNKALMDALKLLVRSDRKLLHQQGQIKSWVEAQASWLERARAVGIAQRDRLRAAYSSLDELRNQLRLGDADRGKIRAQIETLAVERESKLQELELQQAKISALLRRQQDLHDEVGRHVNNLQTQTDAHKEHLKNLQLQTDRALKALLAERDGFVPRTVEHLNNLQASSDSQSEHLKNLQLQTDRALKTISHFQDQRERDDGLVRRAGEHLNNLQTQSDSQGEHLKNLQLQTDRVCESVIRLERFQAVADTQQLGNIRSDLEQVRAGLAEAKDQTRRAEERQTSDGAFLKSELHLLSRAVQELRSTARPGKGKPKGKVALENLADHELDALYVAFENEFRGSRALIKDRVRIYLRDLKKAKIQPTGLPILDIGPGRGEWLELLTESGFIAEGVDSNVFMVAECKERGLQVVEGDGVEYLRSLADNSRAAITGFHIIEHLPPRVMLQLFRETFRVLQSGGVAIFETPNPENILVGSNRFYSDPTHLRPLPKEYTSFVMTSAGFSHVEVRPLHPDKSRLRKKGAAPELRKFINQVFFGEQDYAVIARK